MICQFCDITMDKQDIYGIMTDDEFIVTCKRCYPIKHKNQKTLIKNEG